MVPDLTLETIYYKQPTDFKMEFDLCSVCNTRFLATVTGSGREFLQALQKSVSRSRVTVTVGGLESKDYLPTLLCRALKEEAVPAVSSLNAAGMGYTAPKGAIPLLDTKNRLCGLVIERKEQSIIMLSEDKERCEYAVSNLVKPYFQLIVTKNNQPKTAQPENKEANTSAAPSVAADTVKAAAVAKAVANTDIPQKPTAPKPQEAPKQDLPVGNTLKPENSGKHDRKATNNDDDSNYQGRHSKKPSVNANAEKPQVEQQEPENAETKNAPAVEQSVKPANKAEQPTTFVIEKQETPTTETNKDEFALTLSEDILNDDDFSQNQQPESATPKKEEPQKAFFSLGGPVTEDTVQNDSPKEEPTPSKTENEHHSHHSYSHQSRDEKYTVKEKPEHISKKSADDFKMEPSKSHKAFKIIISILLVIAILAGAFFGYTYLYQPAQADSIYKSIISLYGQKGDKPLPENINDDFGRLYGMNKNIAGILKIDNTYINYPVVKTAAASVPYCNTHLFDGSFNGYGTPYTLSAVDYNSFVRNTVIFGKSLSNGKMFSDLNKFLTLNFYKENPTLTFDYTYGNVTYKIFSVMQFKDGSFNYGQSAFFNDDAFEDFLNNLKSASEINTPVDVSGEDCILTLATKQNSNIIAVFARQLRNNESAQVDVTGSSINVNPIDTDKIISVNNPSAISPTFENINNSSEKYEQNVSSQPLDIPIVVTPSSSAAPLPVNPVTSTISSIIPPKNSSSVTSKVSSKTATSTPPTSSKVSSKTSSVTPVAGSMPTLYVTNSKTGAKEVANGLEILQKVVEAEIGATKQEEALKAQAVAAYGWMLTNGAADGKSYPSVPMKTPSERCKKAVAEVAGIVPVYGGKVAQTFYFDTSAGRTANYDDIWGGGVYSYLKSVDSSVDKQSSAYPSSATYKAADIAKWVKSTYKARIIDLRSVDLMSITDHSKWFKATYDQNGIYVKNISVGGTTIRGSYLRSYVLTSANCGSGKGIRSPAYQITYNKADDTFTFKVYGYGHGVGMSQTGADLYAKNGWNYQQILTHYFTGITFGTYN
ncbi:MAG: SpoIID/LytB domain-containing protein [Oscillospiraceae bacterium]|nr:SpoIID/LytB domain-containing protein [Candidatus Equicaccousia limihippi]